MGKLTDIQIERIRNFADMFGCYFVHNEHEISFEEAIAIFNGEQPKSKSIDERRKDFADSVRPFLVKYGPDMLNKFYKYWAKEEGTKMKFEKQKSWILEQRLAKWYQNDLEYERRRYIEQLNSRM